VHEERFVLQTVMTLLALEVLQWTKFLAETKRVVRECYGPESNISASYSGGPTSNTNNPDCGTWFYSV
jgi:hypothetical protein